MDKNLLDNARRAHSHLSDEEFKVHRVCVVVQVSYRRLDTQLLTREPAVAPVDHGTAPDRYRLVRTPKSDFYGDSDTEPRLTVPPRSGRGAILAPRSAQHV